MAAGGQRELEMLSPEARLALELNRRERTAPLANDWREAARALEASDPGHWGPVGALDDLLAGFGGREEEDGD
jgi:hypothetical protein